MSDLASKTSSALKRFCSPYVKYSRIEDGENGDREFIPKKSQHRDESNSYGNIICVALAFSLIFNAVLLYLQYKSANLDRICSHYTVASESPVSNDIDIMYRTMRFNASFYKENIYRRLACPEVDEAWENLGPKYDMILVPEDQDITTYGLESGQVKRPLSLGGGYPANLEVFHQLHCLNLIRQTSHYNFDYYVERGTHAFSNGDTEDLYRHSTHCLDYLRQVLMCNADYTVFGFYFVEDHSTGMNFNTEHQCKNYDDILAWAENYWLPEDQRMVERRPGDIILEEYP